jgi:hypothetical protein
MNKPPYNPWNDMKRLHEWAQPFMYELTVPKPKQKPSKTKVLSER